MRVLTMELLLVLVLTVPVLVLTVPVLTTVPVLLPVGALVPLRGQPARSLMAPTARTTST